jgi:MFS-type transporter involved in bile tolerance (Atg22 family)
VEKRKKMRFKMTKEEKNWVLYDVGNSAFVLLVSTIMPIYFNYLSEKAGLSSVDYLAFWGYAASIVTIIVAFLGPVLGTVADTKGYKKPIFIITLLIGCIGCFLQKSFLRRYSIFIKILFYKNHFFRKIRRILWFNGCLWKRSFVFRNNSCWCFITNNRSN